VEASQTGAPPARVLPELGRHVPFTLFGTATGLAVMVLIVALDWGRERAEQAFWTLHPLHVLLSAVPTTALYVRYARPRLSAIIAAGYVGSIGIATLSDCLIPYVGEWLLALPHRGVHLGFIEKWWLVNPMALGGIALGWLVPYSKFPHAAHVMVSTWASLFHLRLAMGSTVTLWEISVATLFLFLAVWAPCCTSDIVFPIAVARIQATLRRNE